jgi:hypothetical protein
VPITADTPASGMVFDRWNVTAGGDASIVGNQYSASSTIRMPNNDVTIEALYKTSSTGDDPASIPGCVLWLDGADPNGDGSTVTGALNRWKDKSGNANDAVQNDSAKQPSVVSAELNGKSVVTFDGTDDNLSFSEIADIKTVFWILKEKNQTSDGSNLHFLLGDSSKYDFHRGSGTLWDSTYVADGIKNGVTRVDRADFDGLNTDIPADKYVMVTLLASEDLTATKITKDRDFGRSWDGGIAEIIIYNQALSDTDRDSVETYLYNKWFGTAPVTYSITGTVSGDIQQGVTVAVDATHSTMTDASGNYVISGLTDGAYTVTPSLNGYTFTPGSQTIRITGVDVLDVDFVATANGEGSTYSINGTVLDADNTPIANVLVTVGTVFATTAADGTYTITGVTAGSYNVIPSLDGYAFTPALLPVTVDADLANIDFVAVQGGIPETLNPPVAVVDTYFVQTNDNLVVSPMSGVLANDVNLSNNKDNIMSAVLDTITSNGTLTLSSNGSFTYIPNADFSGVDTFTYHAFNEQANSETVIVTINVIPVGTDVPPTAVGDKYNAIQGGILTVSTEEGVLINDLNASTSTVAIVNQPINGFVTMNPDGSFVYENDDDTFSGLVTFSYKFLGTDPVSSAIVSINVGQIKITLGSVINFTADQIVGLKGENFAKAPKLYGVFENGKKGSLKKIKSSTGSEFSGAWGKKYTLYDKNVLKAGYQSYFEKNGALKPTKVTINAKGKTLAKVKLDEAIYPVQLVPPVITAITDGKDVITTASAGSIITINGMYFGEKAPKVSLEVNGKLLKCKVDKTGMTFMNYKGKSSSMDPATGESSVKVILPAAKKLPSGTYSIILDNKIGIATTSFKEGEGVLPLITIE